METVFLSIGTNMADKEKNLQKALAEITSDAGLAVALSSAYETEPWQMTDADSFLNMVVEIEADLSPHALLEKLLEIENKMGRERKEGGYISRIIDIDILFFSNLIINDSDLIIPHPLISRRRFVLEPLAEIAPSFIHPLFGTTIESLLEACPDKCSVTKTALKL